MGPLVVRMGGHPSRSRLAHVAFGVALLAASVAAAPARAIDVQLEAETLTPSAANVHPQTDSSASNGSALRVSPGSGAEGTIAVPQSTTHMFVRARATDCAGPSLVKVGVDGVERLVGRISTGAYGDVGARMSIPAGQHAVSIAVASSEGFFAPPFCDRSAWIDRITIVGQPFAPEGWRNKRLSKRAPVAPDSKSLVSELRAQIKSRPHGALVGTTQYSSPVYTVPPDQPRVRVQAPADRPDLRAQWASVPLPPDARPAPGSDGHLVVWQPSTDTLWEFWVLSKDTLGKWRARFGGRMTEVSRHEGHFVHAPGRALGATATSIALLAGVQRIEELRRGSIDHAVDLAVLRTGARNGWCWPAQRTDRGLRLRSGIPAGTRFRLPARFDLGAWASANPMSRYALTVARAVQRHGMVVRDTSSEVGFFAEDPGPLGWNPYPQIFENRSPDSRGVLKNFPWRKLQAVASPRCVDNPVRR